MYNHLDATDFQINIPRLPEADFAAKQFTLPGISGSAVKVAGPFNPVNMGYDRVEYEELQLMFTVDENLKNYMAAFNWIKSIGADKALNHDRKNYTSDVIVIPYTSSDRPLKSIKFVNAFPISLSGVEFSTTESDVVYPTATITMTYDFYDFV